MLDEVLFAARSLRLHRLGSALSTVGVVFGVVTFVVLMGVGEGAKRRTLAQIEQLGMRNVIVRASAMTADQAMEARRSGSPGLSLADGQKLRHALPAISRWAAVREIPATVGIATGSAPQVMATGPEWLALQRVELAAGRFITDEDVRNRHLVCVVGDEVMRRLGSQGQLGSTLRIQDSLCRIVGVLRRLDRRSKQVGAIAARDFDVSVLLPIGAELAFAAEMPAVTEIVAEFREAEAVIPSLPLLRRTLAVAQRNVESYQVIAPQELLLQAERARRSFALLLGCIALISLMVGGVGVMNTTLVSVAERAREIGIRRAVGARSRDIARQFLLEAAVLTSIGTLAGSVLGLMLLAVAASLGWPVAVTPWTLLLPVACALLVGCACSVYPALAAARLDPVQALRQS